MSTHRWLVFVVLSAILIAMYAVPPPWLRTVAAAQANLVENPSFEIPRSGDASRPSGWTASGWGTNTAIFSYPHEGAAGARSARVVLTSYTSGDAKWVFDSVGVTPLSSYVYRNAYRSSTITKLVAAFQRADGTLFYTTLKTLAPSAEWTRASATFAIPADARRVSVYHLIAAVGDLQIDDVSMTPPPPVDGSRGVPNGTFEQSSDADPSAPLGWRPSSWGENDATFAYPRPGRGGGHSVHLTIRNHVSGDAKWTYDHQLVTPGTRYRYSDYYLASAETFLVVEVRLSGGGIQYLNLGNLPPSSAFTPASAAFTVPAGALSMTVFHALKRPGNLTIDDVALERLPAVQLVDGVPSGDMETPAYAGADAPAGWSRNVYGSNDAAFSYPREGHAGARSLRVDMRSHASGRAGWYFDPQPVTSGGAYRFRDFYRADVDTTVTAQVWLSSGASVELQLPPAFASSSWSRYVADVFVPSNAVRLTIHHQLGRVGYLQTDDYALQPAVDSPFRRALVSLTFDDGWRTDYENVLPVLEEHDAVATHYVLTGYLGRPDRLTADMLVALAAHGSEIASHTVSHPDLTTLSATDLRTELSAPKPALAALGLGPTTNFASPYGAYNANTVAAIAREYRSHRTTDVGYNVKDTFDVYALKVQNIRATTTPQEVDAWAAQAAATRSWLILVYHDVSDPPASIYGTTPGELDEHLTVLERRDLPIVTVAQALDELLPQR